MALVPVIRGKLLNAAEREKKRKGKKKLVGVIREGMFAPRIKDESLVFNFITVPINS